MNQQINSFKCPECGLVNFASASECKRCHVRFHAPPQAADVTTASELPGEPAAKPQPETREAPQLAPLPEYFAEPAAFTLPVIFFAIGLVVTILAMGFRLVLVLSFMNSSRYGTLTEASLKPIRHLEELVYLELLVTIVVLLGAVVVLVLLSRKSWSFMKWVRVYLFAGLVYGGVVVATHMYLAQAVVNREKSLSSAFKPRPLNPFAFETHWTDFLVAGAMLLGFNWIAYFVRSERIKKIFIQ